MTELDEVAQSIFENWERKKGPQWLVDNVRTPDDARVLVSHEMGDETRGTIDGVATSLLSEVKAMGQKMVSPGSGSPAP